MRGMLYESFLLNRKWFLVAGIISAVGTTIFAIVIANIDRGSALMSMIGMLFPALLALSIVVCIEWLGRHFESNLKCRFVDMTLAGGITKNRFVLALMLENLISIAIGFLMCLAINGVIAVVDNAVGGEIPFWDVFYIKLSAVAALLMGAVEFVCCPLIIKFKSSEKAGITIGLVFGFVVVFPIVLYVSWYKNNVNEEIGMVIVEQLKKIMDAPYFIPVIVGAAAVIYAIVYVVLLNRVKRGDVC